MPESTSQIQNILKDISTSWDHQSYLELSGFSHFTPSRILVKEKIFNTFKTGISEEEPL